MSNSSNNEAVATAGESNNGGGNVAQGQQQPAQQQQQQQQQSGWKLIQSVISRMLIFYFLMQAMNYFKSKPINSTPGSTTDGGVGSPTDPPGNMFAKGTLFDFYVFISEMDQFEQFDDKSALFWRVNDIEYGNWNIGKNQDGIIEYSNQIELTNVCRNFLKLINI